MRTFTFIATIMSLAIAGAGMLGMAAPGVLLDFARSALVPPGLYWVAAVRVVFGALLILVAGESRLPRTLRVIGTVIVIAGLLTPWLGTGRFGDAIGWFSTEGQTVFRAVAALPVLAGLFFAYAINAGRRKS